MERVGFVGMPDVSSPVRQILRRGGCEVALWWPDAAAPGSLSDSGVERVDLETLSQFPLIVVSTSIDDCRGMLRRIGDVITGRQVLAHTVRGVEEGTMNTASRIAYEETPTRRIGFVTGPMRPDDLDAGKPAAAVCASRFPEVHQLVEEAMISPRFRVYHARDLRGAELASIYGRLVALLSGLAEQLQLGASLQATLLSRGLAESARFIEAFEATPRTAFGLAGAGNLYADTIADGDVDRQMGRHLADHPGASAPQLCDQFGAAAAELCAAIDSFRQAARRRGMRVHLLEALGSLVDGHRGPDDILEQLMELPSLEE